MPSCPLFFPNISIGYVRLNANVAAKKKAVLKQDLADLLATTATCDYTDESITPRVKEVAPFFFLNSVLISALAKSLGLQATVIAIADFVIESDFPLDDWIKSTNEAHNYRLPPTYIQ